MRTDEHAQAITTVTATSSASDSLLNTLGFVVRSHQHPASAPANTSASTVRGAPSPQADAPTLTGCAGVAELRSPNVPAVLARPRRPMRGKRSQDVVAAA